MIGAQTPTRIHCVPDAASTVGDDAIEVAQLAGLNLDPWQQLILRDSLGERPDGLWAALEVCVEVPRQNGKGGILEARELAGLFLLDERLIIHSAHQFDTSLEAFRRLLDLIEGVPEFDQRVKRVSRAHGEEGIELKGGQRIRFRTRTKGGGRGFTGDCLILDEAMIISEAMYSALFPTLSARPNPQVWLTGSAVDQTVHEHGRVFARLRERAMRGGRDAARLAYFAWGLPFDRPEDVPDELLDDPAAWAQANPALGLRITHDYLAVERQSMSRRGFAVERLGVGDWPQAGEREWEISPAEWSACADPASGIDGTPVLAVAVRPDRQVAVIAAAGDTSEARRHVEVVDRRAGMSWVPARLRGLVDRHGVIEPVRIDATGPAAALIPDLEREGVRVEPVGTQEMAKACVAFAQDVREGHIRHLGTPDLEDAVKGARTRRVGGAWVWAADVAEDDMTALVACTMAAWGHRTKTARVPLFGWT